MKQDNAVEPAATERRLYVAGSAVLTLMILVSAVVAFRQSSPQSSAPTGYPSFLYRSVEPALAIEAGGKEPPMTFTVATTGLHGTIAALPEDTAQLLLGVAGADPDLQVERSFSTQVEADGSVFATTVLTLLKPEGYATGVITGSRGAPLMYSPPRIELPADAAPGATWSSEGSLNFSSPFTFRGAIAAAEPRDGRRCIKVDTVLDQQSAHGKPYARTTRSTWCEGLGAVDNAVVETGLRFTLAAPGSVSFDPLPPPAAEAIPLGKTLASPFKGAYLSLRPVVMGGLIISTDGSLGDLRAVQPTPDGQKVVWMQHPGGEVLGMAADESLLYVATTERLLMAFDAGGRIHWLTKLPDAVVGVPGRVGDIVTVSLLDGTLRAYDRSTGAQRWSTRLDDTAAVPSVAGAGQIVSADISGLVTATLTDGRVAWSESIGSVQAPMTKLPDGVVLVQDAEGALHAFDSTGGELWTADLGEKLTGEGATIGDTAVLPVESGIVGIHRGDGTRSWHLETPEPPAIDPAGTLTAGRLTGRLTADGALIDRVDLTSDNAESLKHTWPITVGRQRLVVDASGAVTATGDA